jgi:hypothetical protein
MKNRVECQAKRTRRYDGKFWASTADNGYHIKSCTMVKICQAATICINTIIQNLDNLTIIDPCRTGVCPDCTLAIVIYIFFENK